MRSIFDNVTYEKDVPPGLQNIINKYFDNENKFILDGKIKSSVYIYGTVGTGKTRAAYAIKNKVDETLGRWFTWFYNFTDMMMYVKIRESDCKDANDLCLDKISEHKGLLIIDDFGAKQASSFSVDMLYLILNYRYERMLPTIITSNLTLEQVEKDFGERISSRIDRMAVLFKLEKL